MHILSFLSSFRCQCIDLHLSNSAHSGYNFYEPPSVWGLPSAVTQVNRPKHA
jgi:hypothetical protein